MATRDEQREQYIAARQQGMSDEEAWNLVNQPAQQQTYEAPAQNYSAPEYNARDEYIAARKQGLSDSDAYAAVQSGRRFTTPSTTTPVAPAQPSTPDRGLIGNARAALASTDASQSKANKRIDKLLKSYGTTAFNDTFIGQFRANYGLGKIGEELNSAWTRYRDTQSPEDLARVQQLQQLQEQYRQNNAEALDDENVKAKAVTKSFANYLPQLWNQTKASAAPVAIGAVGGALAGEATTPIPIADAVVGAGGGVKAGMVVGSGIYSYNNMLGASYGNILQTFPDVDKNIAYAASADEALVSSVIEMGDTAVELFAKIPGLAKLFEKGTEKAAAAAGAKAIKQAVKSYLGEIGQEYSEEFVQELISIANTRRIENGTADTGWKGLVSETVKLVGELASNAAQGNISDELKQAHEAGVAGGEVAAVGAPIKGAAGIVGRKTFSSISANMHEDSLNTVLQAEVQKASQMEDGGDHAMQAYEKFSDQLNSAKTGDVLYGVNEEGKPFKVGTVTSRNANGIIIQLNTKEQSNVAVPNNFLANSFIEKALEHGAQFGSDEDVAQLMDEWKKKTGTISDELPFTFGKDETKAAPEAPAQNTHQNPAETLAAQPGVQQSETSENAAETVKPAQNGEISESQQEISRRVAEIESRLDQMTPEQMDQLELELLRNMGRYKPGTTERMVLDELARTVIQHDKRITKPAAQTAQTSTTSSEAAPGSEATTSESKTEAATPSPPPKSEVSPAEEKATSTEEKAAATPEPSAAPESKTEEKKSWAESGTKVYDESKVKIEPETEEDKRSREEFGRNLDDVRELSKKLSGLKTTADKEVSENAGRSEKNAARKLNEGMNDLRNKLNDLVAGKMTGDEFADYYNRLEKSGNGMATYWDERVAARFSNALDALEEAKKSGAKDDIIRYQGELTKAITQMVHTIERVDKLNKTLANFGKTASKNAFNTKTKNIVVKLARAYLRWQINPTNVFRLIDGFDKDGRGDGYRYANRIDNCVADYQSLNVELQERLARIKKMETYKEFVSGKKMTGVKIGDTELNVLQGLSFIKMFDTMEATSSDKMWSVSGFALDMGDGKFEFIDNKDVNVKKVYTDLKKSMNDIANEYGKAADEVFDMLGKRIVKTAMAIDGVSPYMFSKGEYFPLWYKTRNDDMHTWSLTRGIDGSLQDKRFTHDRSSENPGYVVISPITKVVDEYITQGTNYAAFGELGNDLRLMNRENNPGGSLSNVMNKNFGEQAAGWMEEYIKDVNEIAEADTEGINSLLRDGRNALAQGALLFSPSVQMKQVASYWSAAGVVRMEALKAAWRFKELGMKGDGLKNALLKYRQLGNVDETLSEALKSGWVKKLQSKSELFKQLSNMTSIKDVRTVDNVYTACVLDVIMDYPDMDRNSATFQKLVNDKFQNAVLNTQPIFTKQARAEYARTDNEFIRMMSMFRTQQTQNLNRLITTVGEFNAAGKKDPTAVKALQQTIKGQITAAFSFAALSVAADMLLHRTKKYRDDDGILDVTKFMERLGLNAVETGAATFWEADALVKWTVDQITKKVDKNNATNEYYGVSFGAVSTLGDVVESLAYLLQSPSLSNLRYTVGYIGTLTGIPVNNIYAMINSAAMYTKDLAGENKDHFDDLLKWTSNENRPERQLVKSFLAGNEDNTNALYAAIGDKAESKVKAEVKDFVLKDDIGHDEAVNLLMKYGGFDSREKADTEVKKYELLADEDINFNTLGEDYREHEKTGKGKVTRDVVMAARINVAGDTEEEAEQYVNKQDFQVEFGFSYDDIKSKYRAGKISADDAVEWRMKCSGVTKESAEEWVRAQDIFLETGYEYVSTGSASYYDSYATKETMGSNTFYDTYGDQFPSRKAFGDVFNDLDTNSKGKKYDPLRNKYGDLGSKQTRVVYTLKDHIAKGNISVALAHKIWDKYCGYSDYNWHFVTD